VLPASAAGQKVELRVDAEGLLTVTVGEGANARAHQLSTRDTPEAVRRTLADRDARKAGEPRVAPAPEPGLLSSLKKMFGRG